MDAIVYDIEIVKAIQGGKEERLEGIEYCGGWRDHENMGISVICAYDYVTERSRVFMADNFGEFAALMEEREFLVGFNNIGFDNKTIRAALGVNINRDIDAWSYDILAEMWRAAGLDPTRFAPATHGGYGLDPTAAINLNGAKKTGHGAMAPVQWQRGEVGAVVDYCLEDVRLTKDLFDQVVTHAILISPKDDNRVLKLRRPDPVLWEAQLGTNQTAPE